MREALPMPKFGTVLLEPRSSGRTRGVRIRLGADERRQTKGGQRQAVQDTASQKRNKVRIKS